jgi:pimeloyl-ACP methyl ester carboxylesterase
VGHYGGAPPPEGAEASVDLFVDGVERDMDAAGWSTAHVAGTSLGGLVALVLAKRGRARTCTAVAPMSTWKRGNDRGLNLVAHSYRFFLWITKLMARDPPRWSRRSQLRRILYWHHFAHAEGMEPAYASHMIVGAAHATILPTFIDWAREHDGPNDLDQIACRVQLLFPTKDLVFPAPCVSGALGPSPPESRGPEPFGVRSRGDVRQPPTCRSGHRGIHVPTARPERR